MIVEPPLPKKTFCNWEMFIYQSALHFEINIHNDDGTVNIIQNHWFLVKY